MSEMEMQTLGLVVLGAVIAWVSLLVWAWWLSR
jgi:hypothetical protein